MTYVRIQLYVINYTILRDEKRFQRKTAAIMNIRQESKYFKTVILDDGLYSNFALNYSYNNS